MNSDVAMELNRLKLEKKCIQDMGGNENTSRLNEVNYRIIDLQSGHGLPVDKEKIINSAESGDLKEKEVSQKELCELLKEISIRDLVDGADIFDHPCSVAIRFINKPVDKDID